MPSPATKKFITFVGDPQQSHPSFRQAFEAGIIASWVRNPRELILDLARTPFTNLIIFDARHASELQCAVCHNLTAQGYRIVCIGAARPECLRNYIAETDLLSAILAAVPTPPPRSLVTSNWLERHP